MREYLILLKCDLLRLFGINKALHSKNKKEGKKLIGLCVLAVVLALIAVALSIVYTGLFVVVLPSESKYMAVSFIYTIFCFIVLFTTIFNSASVVFGCKDYDTLMSLPVKTQTIALAKCSYIYIFNLVIAILVMFPSVMLFGFLTNANLLLLFLNTLLFVFFAPLPPILLGFIVGTLVTLISTKIKNKKWISLFFSVIALVAYFAFIFSSSNTTDEQFAQIITSLSGFLTPASFVIKGIIGKFLNLIIFILACCIITFLFVEYVGKNYKKINTLVMTKRTTSNFKMTEQQQNSYKKTLFVREFKLWGSNVNVIMNTAVTSILLVAFSILALIKGKGIFAGDLPQEEMSETLSIVTTYFQSFLPLIPIFFVGMSYYSACSVSLEGKSLWILKSLPVKAIDVFIPKILVNLVITVPASVISLICFGLMIGSPFYDIIFSIILVSIYCVFGSVAGLIINLRHPNFEWNNPTEVVKRGTSATIAMFGGMLAIIPIGALQLVCSFVSKYLGWGLLTAILLIVNYFMISYLTKNGEKVYKRL